MDGQKLINSLQVASSIVLVAGLVFVYWELQQAKQVATAQLTSDSFAYRAAHQTALYGEHAAEVYARACSDPANLSHSEQRILWTMYSNLVSQPFRLKLIQERSGLYPEWERVAKLALNDIFSDLPGRAWWNVFEHPDPEIERLGDEILQSLGPPECGNRHKLFEEDIARMLKVISNN